MKQIPYLCNDQSEFSARIAEFKGILPTMPEYSCVLATIYVDSDMKKEVPDLVKILKQELPDIHVVGGTVSANITAGVINLCGIALTFMVFFQSQVEIIPLEWEDSRSADIGKKLLGEIRQMYQPVAVQLISSGYNLHLEPFLNELSNIPEDIAVFGGIVDDGTVSGQGFVFTDTTYIQRGMLVIVYKGRNLFVNLCSSSGWQPLGRSMQITGLADNNTTITELDDSITIRDAYERYLGISWDDSFLDEAVVFPVCVNRDGTILNRMPRRFGQADGSANYGADFQLGENIQICYGNPTVVVQGTYMIQYEMLRFQPEGIFAVSCWSRKVLLNRDVNQELEVCRSGVSSTGIYALGEYIRDDTGKIYLNNMYLSIMGMREGGINNRPHDASYLCQKVQFVNWGNSVISHMMHFVQAVSCELEEYNEKLKHIADTDKLTGLYNRGAIDRILEQEIRRAKLSSSSVALILVDLDNFKSINDQFGHLVGDASLMRVANVMKEVLPEGSIAGRWGGDEFVVLLTNVSSNVTLHIAEKIRRGVEQIAMETEHLHITISIGAAVARSLEDAATLFKRADDALYEAKYKYQRNNVRLGR